MILFPWTAFLPEGFENGKIQRFLTGDYMTWGSISLSGGFLENVSRKRKSFGNFDCDLREFFTKGFFLTENELFRNFSFYGKFSIFTDSRSYGNISRQFENFEIYRDLYGKPFKHDWVAIKSGFSHTDPSNFRRLMKLLLLRYTAENSQVT